MRSGETLNVALVEDHHLVREALAALLRQTGFDVIYQTDSVAAAREAVPRLAVHVAIIDVHLPDGNGVALARRLGELAPHVGTILCTGDTRRATLLEALDSGAHAVVLKQGPPQEALQAVRAVAGGRLFLAPAVRESVTAPWDAEDPPVLSPREREVLRGLADGHETEDLARDLSISAETVKSHVRNIMAKLGVHSRVHALAEAIRRSELQL